MNAPAVLCEPMRPESPSHLFTYSTLLGSPHRAAPLVRIAGDGAVTLDRLLIADIGIPARHLVRWVVARDYPNAMRACKWARRHRLAVLLVAVAVTAPVPRRSV